MRVARELRGLECVLPPLACQEGSPPASRCAGTPGQSAKRSLILNGAIISDTSSGVNATARPMGVALEPGARLARRGTGAVVRNEPAARNCIAVNHAPWARIAEGTKSELLLAP